jgi:hypothetical protein
MTPQDKQLLFELHTKDGHTYKLYLNGETEGLPEGTCVINRALPLINYLYALSVRKEDFPTELITGAKAKIVA